MASLDVDGIKVADNVNKIYIDLGLPTNDSNAISEIKSLLASLDPANDAKLINAAPNTPIDYSFATRKNGSNQGLDVSLVISSDLANALFESLGGSDLSHLSNLGIGFAVVDNTATGNYVVPQGVPNMPIPKVEVIGQNTDLFNELDPLKPIP